jgi:hypothetical protein
MRENGQGIKKLVILRPVFGWGLEGTLPIAEVELPIGNIVDFGSGPKYESSLRDRNYPK